MNEIQRKALRHLLDPEGDATRRRRVLEHLIEEGVFFDTQETEADSLRHLESLLEALDNGLTLGGLGFCADGLNRFRAAVFPPPEFQDLTVPLRVRAVPGLTLDDVRRELIARLTGAATPTDGVTAALSLDGERWLETRPPVRGAAPQTDRPDAEAVTLRP